MNIQVWMITVTHVSLFVSFSWAAFLKTWLPFFMLCGVLATFILTFNLQ